MCAAMMYELTAHGKDAEKWQAFADRLDRGSVMLTPAYARVQEIAEGTDAVCLVYEDADAFVMLPGLISDVSFAHWKIYCDMHSFFGGGGPAAKGSWVVADRVFDGWRVDRGVICEYAQLRLGEPTFGPPMLLQESKRAVVVDIHVTNSELVASFSRNRRRQIKDQYVYRVVADDIALRRFHLLYCESMARVGASSRWMYPEQAWRAYRDNLGDGQHMALFSNGYAMLLIVFGYGDAYAHFLGVRDNALDQVSALYYASMLWARDAGCRRYYLGGGLTGAPDDKLLQYKLGFSKTTVPVYTYKRIYDSVVYARACERLKDKSPTFFPAYRAEESHG